VDLEFGWFETERAMVADLSASSASVNNTPLCKREKFWKTWVHIITTTFGMWKG